MASDERKRATPNGHRAMHTDAEAYRIVETGQRVNALELELHLCLGVWRVLDRDDGAWTVRNADGEDLTLVPVGQSQASDSNTDRS